MTGSEAALLRPLWHPFNVLAALLLGLAWLLATACGPDAEGGPLGALSQVAPIKQGQPLLVFVYTDG